MARSSASFRSPKALVPELVCKVCGSPARSLPPTSSGLPAGRCLECKLYFITEVPQTRSGWSQDKDILESYYADVYRVLPEKFHYGLRQIRHYFPKVASPTLMDIGCGSGHFLELARSAGFDARGIEDNPRLVEICVEKGLDVTSARLDELHDPPDIVTLFDVVEHVERPIDFFQQVAASMNPDGIVYIETPRQSLLDHYLNIGKRFSGISFDRVTSEHVQQFSDKALQIALRKAGFRILSYEKRQSLSWADPKRYLKNMRIKSPLALAVLTMVAKAAIRLRLFGRNKAVVVATPEG